ncbi:protein of unknown function [Hyphomicrobium sp. MC1]|nr:protein of unknown function [Hyphomicrobium sp. MC1]
MSLLLRHRVGWDFFSSMCLSTREYLNASNSIIHRDGGRRTVLRFFPLNVASNVTDSQ